MENLVVSGEMLSLGCAVAWATGVIFMRKSTHEVSPLILNLFKILLATLLFIPTILIAGESLVSLLLYKKVAILCLSGIIGIGIADTLWLSALKKTNASTVAIIDCSYSPSVVGLSFVFLGEVLSWMQFLGGLIVISSLFLVAIYNGEKSFKKESHIRKNDHQGVVHGTLAVILMAIGVVLMKPVLDDFPLFLAIEIRLFAGLVFLMVQLLLTKGGLKQFKELRKVKDKWSLFIGSFFAAYFAMILWVAGTKYTDASIAAILNQTSTFFIIIFAALILRESINKAKILGCVGGFLGCLMIAVDGVRIQSIFQAFRHFLNL